MMMKLIIIGLIMHEPLQMLRASVNKTTDSKWFGMLTAVLKLMIVEYQRILSYIP